MKDSDLIERKKVNTTKKMKIISKALFKFLCISLSSLYIHDLK